MGIFDITVTQPIGGVHSGWNSGVVGGTQQSLNAIIYHLSFAIGIVVPDPCDFHMYVSSVCGAVSSEQRSRGKTVLKGDMQ